jgi:hypothetical protein
MTYVNDIETVYPGMLQNIHNFLRDYKIPDGKPANKFAFDGNPQNKVRLFVFYNLEANKN